jgi:hypothetical protein
MCFFLNMFSSPTFSFGLLESSGIYAIVMFLYGHLAEEVAPRHGVEGIEVCQMAGRSIGKAWQ